MSKIHNPFASGSKCRSNQRIDNNISTVRPSGLDNDGAKNELSAKEKNWGKVKFNPTPTAPRVERATPWRKYKAALMAEHENNRRTKAGVMDSEEAKEYRKKREQNYRKELILRKQKEVPQWENFEDEEPQVKAKKSREEKEKHQANSDLTKEATNTEPISTIKNPLETFNCKVLPFKRANLMRQVITKTTIMCKGNSLKRVLYAKKRKQQLLSQESGTKRSARSRH